MAKRDVGRRPEAGLRLHGWIGGSRAVWFDDDTGATTAEFAIVTMAAVGFAGLLVVILRSEQVRAILEGLVSRALNSAG